MEKSELIKAFKDFSQAAIKLVEELQRENYVAVEDYPPNEPSFEELACDLVGWAGTQVNILESQIFCPDCGSHNVEVVEGPIMQCDANHSGECQDCFTAWTID